MQGVIYQKYGYEKQTTKSGTNISFYRQLLRLAGRNDFDRLARKLNTDKLDSKGVRSEKLEVKITPWNPHGCW